MSMVDLRSLLQPSRPVGVPAALSAQLWSSPSGTWVADLRNHGAVRLVGGQGAREEVPCRGYE